MKEQFITAIDWIKSQDIDGCITGSILLDYFPDDKQDIDVFVYNEASFTKLIYTMKFNPMFSILAPLEEWKFKDWTETSNKGSLKKLGLISLKFHYNNSIEINVIYKEKHQSVFDVLASFDMDIVCKGIDLRTKQVLDLTNGANKIASWNKFNKAFYKTNIWSISRILRQFGRLVKYHKRGYNTDLVTLRYKELLENVIKEESIFKSIKVTDQIEAVKHNGAVLIQIFDKWLETHEMTNEQLELINETLKKI
jgi:hypothetical protein